MSALQIVRLVVIGELATSLAAALRCATSDSSPADVLSAASRNAAAAISAQLECAAEGV